ncbi:MAG: signal recognition particle-docking protein FtsY [bacterium]
MFFKRKSTPVDPVELSSQLAGDEENQQDSSQGEPEQEEIPSTVVVDPPKKRGLFSKLVDRLRASRDAILKKTISVFQIRGRIDDELLDDLEETLITADIGVETTLKLIDHLRDQVKFQKKTGSTDINWLTGTLKEAIASMIASGSPDLITSTEGPSVYLIVGVNGVGKTTAIGKIAYRLRLAGKKVLVVAADTFRAAAIDQLAIWAERAGCDIVRGQEGSDPSSVVYDAVHSARSQGHDVVIIDTAGRLHTRYNLMQELAKMGRVVGRGFSGAPHETLLVLDASTGQNALQQARQFTEACGVTGMILTKLDGTAKGGVIIAVHDQLKIPVKFIGIGEKIDDLEPFDADAFLEALFTREEEG